MQSHAQGEKSCNALQVSLESAASHLGDVERPSDRDKTIHTEHDVQCPGHHSAAGFVRRIM